MVARCQTHLSWGRPNKRYLRTAYLPGKTRQPAMGKVVIGVDTSGSIGDEEIAKFLGHLSLICEQCDPESVDVLYVTDKVEQHEHYDRGEYDFEPVHNRWSGGTDMREVTRWADEHCDQPSNVHMRLSFLEAMIHSKPETLRISPPPTITSTNCSLSQAKLSTKYAEQ